MPDAFDELNNLAREIDQQRGRQNKLTAEQNKIKEKYLDLIQSTLRDFAFRVWTIRYKKWNLEGLDPLIEADRESNDSLQRVGYGEDSIAWPSYWSVDQKSERKYTAGYEFEHFFVLLEIDSKQVFTGSCAIGVYGYGGWKSNIKIVSKLLSPIDSPTFIVDEVVVKVNDEKLKQALVKLYKTHGDSKL